MELDKSRHATSRVELSSTIVQTVSSGVSLKGHLDSTHMIARTNKYDFVTEVPIQTGPSAWHVWELDKEALAGRDNLNK
jgi:hypothetical protein